MLQVSETPKKQIVVTKEMAEEIRRFYKKQGVTDTDLDVRNEEGALAETPTPKFEGVSWRRWKTGNGFIATCSYCRARGEFEEVTKAGRKALRFRHCGRADRLPLLLRWFA
jgi:hypothetical protein